MFQTNKVKTEKYNRLGICVETHEVIKNGVIIGHITHIRKAVNSYFYAYNQRGMRIMTDDERPATYNNRLAAIVAVQVNYTQPVHSFTTVGA